MIPTPPVPPMSPAVRSVLYAVFAWVSFALAVVAACFAALVGVPPVWLNVALIAVPLAGTYLGFMAKANVPAGEEPGDGGPV